jgi:hypothetical protein
MRVSRGSLQYLSVRLARSESCYEISFFESRKKQFSLRNLREASLTTNFDSRVSRKSRENFGSKKRVSLLILTRESHENLARIFCLKSESRFSREFQKVILVSTLDVSSTLPLGNTAQHICNQLHWPHDHYI